MLRFSCSQLVVDRLDPLVNPGMVPSPHLHQVVGGNAFNISMDRTSLDIPSTATCTSCTPSEDFSVRCAKAAQSSPDLYRDSPRYEVLNYWTATLFFRARNGTFKAVKTKGQHQDLRFQAPTYRTAEQLKKYPMLTYTCLQTSKTRGGDTTAFPKDACKVGIMVSIRFPTCWDGTNLDSPDHQSHTAYPSGGKCPSTHPVQVSQLFYETIWDTTPFNDKSLWPADGSQPFVWSFGDKTGYGIHGDYVFGWKGDALQRAMDSNSQCNSDLLGNKLNCPALKGQTIEQGNKCTKSIVVEEKLDGWLSELPGGMAVG